MNRVRFGVVANVITLVACLFLRSQARPGDRYQARPAWWSPRRLEAVTAEKNEGEGGEKTAGAAISPRRWLGHRS